MLHLFIGYIGFIANQPPTFLQQRAGEFHEYRQLSKRPSGHRSERGRLFTSKVFDSAGIHINVIKT